MTGLCQIRDLFPGGLHFFVANQYSINVTLTEYQF